LVRDPIYWTGLLTGEVAERSGRQQVDPVGEVFSGTKGSETPWTAEELSPGSHRTQLFHSTLFRSTVLKPHLERTNERHISIIRNDVLLSSQTRIIWA